MNKFVFTLIATLAFALSANSQEKQDKFPLFVTGLGDAVPVLQILSKKINESKPFVAVGQKDPSKVVVLISCMAGGQGDWGRPNPRP